MNRRILSLAPVGLVAALVAALTLVPGAGADHQPARESEANPCLERSERRELRLICPDLRMRPPFDIQVDRVGGRKVLRAGNSIDSVGRGPAELRGRRVSARRMRAKQRIHVRGPRRHRSFATGAVLKFQRVPVDPGRGRYWKWKDAARLELWRLNRRGRRVERVDVGPKQVYCLRDLQRTNPHLRRSPSSMVYPGCSQDPGQRRRTLGTSVGWSDVYPSNYHQQWVDLSDVDRAGCYAYVHTADPLNGIYELNEHNNEASTVVRLGRNGRLRGICENRRDRGVRPAQQGDGTPPPGVDPSFYPDDGYGYGEDDQDHDDYHGYGQPY